MSLLDFLHDGRGLLETRIPNPNAQHEDGSFIQPLNSENKGSAIIPQTLLFSQIVAFPITAVGVAGYQVPLAGMGVILNPASDPSTVIYISFDETYYIKMTPGVRISAAQRFERVWIKASASLPSTGQSFELDFFQNDKVEIKADTPSSGGSLVGAPNWALTYTAALSITPGAGTNVCPSRNSRRRVVIANQGPGSVFLGTAAATVGPVTGEFLPAGSNTVFQSIGDIFALADTASTIVTAREEYSNT